MAIVIKSNVNESEWKEKFVELDHIVSQGDAKIPSDSLLFTKLKKVHVEEAPAPDADVYSCNIIPI